MIQHNLQITTKIPTRAGASSIYYLLRKEKTADVIGAKAGIQYE